MTWRPLAIVTIAVLALSACEKPKDRSAIVARNTAAYPPFGSNAPPAPATPAQAPAQAPAQTSDAAAAPAPAAAAPAPPAPAAIPAPIAPVTAGLPLAPGVAGFYVDYVGQAPDPLYKQPARVAQGPIKVGGFAFDGPAKKPAKGVDLAIDGKLYGVAYGAPRPDVGGYYKTPALNPTGYSVLFPAGAIGKGPHTLIVRVIGSDGKAYRESPPVHFEVN